MTFHDWYDTNLHRLIKGNLHDALQKAWQAAQQAERERERGKVLTEGWDDRYATAIKALAEERVRAQELVEALHRINMAAQNSMYSKYACGNIARSAIAKYDAESNER